MDLLSEVLQSIEVEAASFVNFHLPAPWGLAIRDADAFSPAYCYCLVEGQASAFLPGQPAVVLAPGDMLVFPSGGASTIASASGAPVSFVGDIWRGRRLPDFGAGEDIAFPAHLHFNGDGPRTHLLALAFRFRGDCQRRFLSALPQAFMLQAGHRPTVPFLRAAIDFLAADSDSDSPGHTAIANELGKLVFISLLREHVLHDRSRTGGWLQGLLDRQIGKAMLAIHRHPGRPWTVAALAAEAGMSRSSFAERFVRCAGKSPFEYLTDWRILCAEDALIHSEQPVAAIVVAAGYQSESAFRKVFIRKHGVPPGEYRKRKRQA